METNKLANHILNTFMDFISQKGEIYKSVLFDEHINPIEFNFLNETKYVNKNIAKRLKEFTHVGYTKTISIHNVHMQYEFWDNHENIKEASFFYNYACFLIYLISKWNKDDKNLKLVLINYDGKKKTPENHIFTSEHVNSGVTFYYSNYEGNILVYRKEEMVKVLTHEMIHFFDIDAKHIDVHKEKEISTKFCLNESTNSINVNEAFTDALACVINIIMYTIIESSITNSKFKTLLKNNFVKEIGFIKSQARRVLNHVKYDESCSIHNMEETHAISYYVIKSVILSDMKGFMKYLENNNYRLANIEEFITLVLLNINKINWKTYGIIDYNIYKDVNTMRMSSLDIINLIKY